MDMLSSNDAIFTTQTTCLCDEHLQINYFLGILKSRSEILQAFINV